MSLEFRDMTRVLIILVAYERGAWRSCEATLHEAEERSMMTKNDMTLWLPTHRTQPSWTRYQSKVATIDCNANPT
ncbi:hypothetical protein M404DRAFT_725211 [Pisolithus tinctorius Marx 270]|uniref:Uncharacterized protein n=1 Tax=Pisolithus tinctorius Marx 270 TaxID=870435 RepID=A0A0C3JWG3_PISTI|nr:hypothetical protein M404DRAFT_725211 [Pisolithus tinctorius Marx 270]